MLMAAAASSSSSDSHWKYDVFLNLRGLKASAPVSSLAKYSGFSSSSSILHKSIPKLGRMTRTTQYKSPFLDCTKRYYYVDWNRVHHFKPRGPRKWFENPGNVLIVGLVGFWFLIIVYFGNLETILYTKQTHFIILSKALEKRLWETQFQQMKESFKGDILPAIHPDSVWVWLIAKDRIEALQRGLSHEMTWTDVDYASGKVEPAHEGGGKDILMVLHDAPDQGKWSREDEILDDQWIEESRKTSRERGLKAATSHLDQLNWEVLVVDRPVINAFCLPGGKLSSSRDCSSILEVMQR